MPATHMINPEYEARKSGFIAYHDKRGLWENPFDAGSQHNSWRLGWGEASDGAREVGIVPASAEAP